MKKTLVITLISVTIFSGAHATTYDIQNKLDSQVKVKLEADNNTNVVATVNAGQSATITWGSLPTKLTVTNIGTGKERLFKLDCSTNTIIQIIPYAIAAEGYSVSMQEKPVAPPA